MYIQRRKQVQRYLSDCLCGDFSVWKSGKGVIAVSISFPKLQKTVLERNKPSLGQKPKFQQADRT